MVKQIRRELLASMPLTVVLAAGVGAGLITFLVNLLSQRASLSLEALLVALINVVAPMAVTLTWISSCAPQRVGEAAVRQGQTPIELATAMGSAAICATLLLPYILATAMVAGALATSVPEPLRQLPPLLGLLSPAAMARMALHGAGLTAISALICARQGRRCRHRSEDLPRRIAAATVEAILVILSMEVLLFILVPPDLPPIG
ncbi:hypothetical protein [Synechococcus sp. RedBA-s]|uniref:hypothetical protein n=1 Tax=Synechococcus sp. RedBA-s TaxID=2823741 RepID=UPI0020CB951C|nr:hypothetical protein [Synechococcus sp. RedBA-s]MCP9800837.1 hypothetical protein [Synechococcus sp. RedBA-s]